MYSCVKTRRVGRSRVSLLPAPGGLRRPVSGPTPLRTDSLRSSVLRSVEPATWRFLVTVFVDFVMYGRAFALDTKQKLDPCLTHVGTEGRSRSKRAIGLHFAAAEAIRDYVQKAAITSGPLFRARASSRAKDKLSTRPMDEVTMYRLLMRYLERLPKAMREVELDGGEKVRRCIYTPHSLRATTATLLLDAGVDITEVQQLLGHKHVTVTQVYDKRRRSTRESASHKVPL